VGDPLGEQGRAETVARFGRVRAVPRVALVPELVALDDQAPAGAGLAGGAEDDVDGAGVEDVPEIFEILAGDADGQSRLPSPLKSPAPSAVPKRSLASATSRICWLSCAAS
jgi:hypothetical protein